MSFTVNFDLPAEIAGRLMSGEMVRRGGVIQWAEGMPKAGKVVAWLREVAPEPSAPAEIGKSLLGKAGSALQLVGNVASVVNLGATVGFGIATLRKLGKMDSKLNKLLAGQEELLAGQEKLLAGQEQIQRTLDVGFWQMATGFEQLLDGEARIEGKIDEKFQDEVVAAVNSATEDLNVLVVPLDRGDPCRIARTEQILGRVSPAYELLALDAEKRTAALAQSLKACVGGRQKLNITSDHIVAMYRLRMACSAAVLKARVIAESGQPHQAVQFLHQQAPRVRSLLARVGAAMFAEGALVYDDLLHHFWAANGVTAERVGRWAELFDRQAGGLPGAIRRVQDAGRQGQPLDSRCPALQTHWTLAAGRSPDDSMLREAIATVAKAMPRRRREQSYRESGQITRYAQ